MATGVLLIGSITLGAQDTQWLSAITVGAANNQCDAQGQPKGCFFTPEQDTGTPLASLKGASLKLQQDNRLKEGKDFIANQGEVVALGKALFWDQQVGSDGQACGSCHFSAGADPRIRNAVSPGLKATPVDNTYSFGGADTPNYKVVEGDFPSHLLANPDRRGSTVLQDSNDVVGSAGVFNRKFTAVGSTPILNNPNRVPSVPDVCRSVADPDGFHIGDINVRKVEPRNTPTMINAVFNNRNFWDGRAQDVFNGANPFGARDPNAVIYRFANNTLTAQGISIKFASLASQAVGPPLSNFEMSCENRTFPDVGHKMLGLRPLALQAVAPSDKVLGRLVGTSATGLSNTRYRDMVQRAFSSELWSSRQGVNINGTTYSQMEANFSLFWGLSLKAYMETLVADNSPVDQFLNAPAKNSDRLSDSAKRGLNIFQSFGGVAPDPTDPTGTKTINVNLSTGKPADARCITCHGGAETSNANPRNIQSSRLERMIVRNPVAAPACQIYDQGFLNTGVRPNADDVGVAGLDPFNNSFSETVLAGLGIDSFKTKVPSAEAPFGLTAPVGGTGNCEGAAVEAAFKTPGLRNVELTGPYFHNGGQATLMQVVDFYNRGGDFNSAQVDENIKPLGLAERDKRDLVNFLIALTDERVAHEQAPFDHPSICVANGQQGDDSGVAVGPSLPGGGRTIAADRILCVPASGAAGIANRLPTFLNADPHDH